MNGCIGTETTFLSGWGTKSTGYELTPEPVIEPSSR